MSLPTMPFSPEDLDADLARAGVVARLGKAETFSMICDEINDYDPEARHRLFRLAKDNRAQYAAYLRSVGRSLYA
ncbi:hypothetical protein [Rhodoblastus sp.]|uniref:hypothetical protein n=1 Tax=Rhodoblastus sp. TaxID=1962975 RepID=UPI0035B05580